MIDINRLSVGDKVVFTNHSGFANLKSFFTTGKEYKVLSVNRKTLEFEIINNKGNNDPIRQNSLSGYDEFKWFDHVESEPMYNNYSE